MSIPNHSSFRILSRLDVETLLPMKTAIKLMESAFSQLSSGKAQVPIRTHLHLDDIEAEALFMPVYLSEQAHTGLKMVNMNPKNPALGLPLIQALMLVTNARTGRAMGMMDAASITAIRTGAASGLATDLLAREDAKVLAVFGTGGQAYCQIEAILAVRDIQHIWVYGRDEAKGVTFTEKITEKFEVNCQWANSLTKLSEADIICTSTTSSNPLFALENLKPGVHINGIGAYRADMAEIDAKIVGQSQVYVDQRAACIKEAGDIIQAIEKGEITKNDIIGELGELVVNKIKGRQDDNSITFFKSVGNAAQDLVCGSYLLEEAQKENIGTEVNI